MSMLLAPQTIASMKAYGIAHAAQFDGATGYLSWLPTTAGDRKTWTLSMWVARAGITGYEQLLSAGVNAQLYFDTTAQTLRWTHNGSYNLNSSQVFRDPTTPLHLVLVWDSTATTHKVYINGMLVSDFTTETYPTLDLDGTVNSIITHNLGRYTSGVQYFSGILAEVRFIDGQALTPDDFGALDLVTGNWIAKKYTGTYGSNGFYLDFSNATNLGEDQSGNGNDWTVNGTVTQVTSTPTNVYATLNPLIPSGGTLANGNTRLTTINGEFNTKTVTLVATSGKYKIEGVQVSYSAGNCAMFSLVNNAEFEQAPLGDPLAGGGYGYYANDGNLYTASSVVAQTGGASFTNGDVIDITVDFDTLESKWYKNNTLQYTQALDPETTYALAVGDYSAARSCVIDVDFTEGTYQYAGFETLCTDNLPTVNDWVGNHFKSALYTGTGVDGHSIGGLGFQPDFVWIKDRTTAYDHHLYDSARGAGRTSLNTNNTLTEGNYDCRLASFDSDGFTVGDGGANEAYINKSGDSFVAWCAKLPNTKDSGWPGGTITPTKEIYNDSAMFKMSVVTYTGNGVAGATIPHSLGVKPGVVIVKRLDATGGWPVYHSSLGATQALWLDLTNAPSTSNTYWNDTEPTGEQICLGSDARVNASGGTYVAYVFAPSGGIKIGDYTGNGSADGPLINEMISPAFELHKKTSAVDEWIIQDSARSPYNPTGGKCLKPNSDAAEAASGDGYDWLANGWKIRTTASNANSSGGTYVYLMIGQPMGPVENTAR